MPLGSAREEYCRVPCHFGFNCNDGSVGERYLVRHASVRRCSYRFSSKLGYIYVVQRLARLLKVLQYDIQGLFKGRSCLVQGPSVAHRSNSQTSQTNKLPTSSNVPRCGRWDQVSS